MEQIIIILTAICISEGIAIKYLLAENKYQKQLNKNQKKMLNEIYYGNAVNEPQGTE